MDYENNFSVHLGQNEFMNFMNQKIIYTRRETVDILILKCKNTLNVSLITVQIATCNRLVYHQVYIKI